MKKNFIAIALLWPLTMSATSVSAATLRNAANPTNSIVKVPAKKVTNKMFGLAIETTSGSIFGLNQFVGGSPLKAGGLKKLLKKNQLELRSGHIIYREEIKYGLIKGLGKNSPWSKAPHTPD